MYYTGVDPFAKKEVYVARGLRDRKMQRSLMQFFKPENYFMVREALIQARRRDLIGGGCDCVANPSKGEKPGERGLPNRGYRPGRKSAKRQQGKKKGEPKS